MAEIDLDGPEALFRQLAAILEKRIADGIYEPNRAIPSETKLREEFGVGRTTVRAAIEILAGKGLVVSVQGKGVFVVEQTTTDD